MSRAHDALIVDFGGVLTTPLQDSMVRFADEVGIELQDVVRVALAAYSGERDDLVVDFETGRIGEEEFGVALAARLSEVTGKDVSADRLVDRLFGTLLLEESMFEALAAVKRSGYKTALLSNSWGLKGYPRERFEGLLDVVVISGEVGMRKPDPAIYAFATERLGVDAARCVFVDDHPGHLKAAAQVGMTTVLHKSPEETVVELERILELDLTPKHFLD